MKAEFVPRTRQADLAARERRPSRGGPRETEIPTRTRPAGTFLPAGSFIDPPAATPKVKKDPAAYRIQIESGECRPRPKEEREEGAAREGARPEVPLPASMPRLNRAQIVIRFKTNRGRHDLGRRCRMSYSKWIQRGEAEVEGTRKGAGRRVRPEAAPTMHSVARRHPRSKIAPRTVLELSAIQAPAGTT
jgi:hypothetical protein